MRKLRTVVSMVSIAFLSACAQVPSTPTNPIDSREVLLSFSGTPGPRISVGDISAADPDLRAIRCRGAGSIAAPGEMTYAKYIQQTLIDQFTIAPGYAADSRIRLEGRLDRIDFSSVRSGKWEIDMTFWAEGIAPFKINSVYHFPTSMNPDVACPQVGRALSGAMYDLLARLVVHPSFQKMIASTE